MFNNPHSKHFAAVAGKCYIIVVISLIFFGVTISCDQEEEEIPSPSITSFSPAGGIPGTEISITGSNFEDNATENNVTVGAVSVQVINGSKESLRVVLPEGASTGRISVTNSQNKTATSSLDFIVYAKLSLNGFLPLNGEAGTVITISGSGFSAFPLNNVVTIGGVQATVTTATNNSLTVMAPADGVTGEVVVTANDQTVAGSGVFEYVPKIAQVIPSIIFINAEMIISGTGFSPTVINNRVFFQAIEATILQATANTLKVRVPAGATTGTVRVQSNGRDVIGPICKIVIEALSSGGSGYDIGHDIVRDQAGNFYVVGSFDGSATFGAETVTGQGSDIFIAKYNSEGTQQWVRTAGGGNMDQAVSVSIDDAGNIYVVGLCSDDPIFGSIVLDGMRGGFLAKMDPSGTFLWVKKFSTSSSQWTDALDVALDPDGNPIIVGGFGGAFMIGAQTVHSIGTTNSYIAKFDKTNGDALFLKSFPTTGSSHGTSIACSSNGDIFVSASFFGEAVFGTNTFTSPSATDLDAFLIKLDNAGSLIWAKHFAGTGWNAINDLKFDNAGLLLVTGYFGTTLIGAGINLTAFGNESMFLAKLSQSGTAMWTAVGNSSYAAGRRITTDASNNIFVAGNFEGSVIFDNQVVSTQPNSRQALLVKYTSQGSYVWARQAGGAESDQAAGVALDEQGIITVTGSFRNYQVTFGGTTVPNNGNDDIFWWKILQ